MRVLSISDTHIPGVCKKLPYVIEKEAKESDCCIHSGDFVTYSVFETLSKWVKTYGVCGNMDDDNVRKKLPEKQTMQLEDITLGLFHGTGHPDNLTNCVNKVFADTLEKIDIFVFGHSHYPYNKEINGKIYFNPGSLTDEIFAPYRSYGVLEINGKNIKRRIVKIG